ncbi:Fur-regulated basic protein FbpA [Bacillus massiliglaciei]|uniref:Fur-regulated basic protein FbpA n=1 Tax=Bacillus massiliglaciei TaxID=1816693 RepID=UPI000DA5F45F|nr:Fur-regulated basic protein FbpA [Bacillus massiliglaciei]
MEEKEWKGVEDKRNSLVNQLIACNWFKKDGFISFNDLTLKQAEIEYRKFLSESHPHDSLDSLRWISRKC